MNCWSSEGKRGRTVLRASAVGWCALRPGMVGGKAQCSILAPLQKEYAALSRLLPSFYTVVNPVDDAVFIRQGSACVYAGSGELSTLDETFQ